MAWAVFDSRLSTLKEGDVGGMKKRVWDRVGSRFGDVLGSKRGVCRVCRVRRVVV